MPPTLSIDRIHNHTYISTCHFTLATTMYLFLIETKFEPKVKYLNLTETERGPKQKILSILVSKLKQKVSRPI